MTEVLKEKRLVQLKTLLAKVAEKIDTDPGARDLAQLAKQYREILFEIEEIEGVKNPDDEIAEILTQRQSDGRAGAVRKNKTKV